MSAVRGFAGRWGLLLALVVVAGLRGLYWVAVTDVWHGDEPQHYAYVQHLATGQGLPVLGEDRVPQEVVALAKESATNGYRSTDISAAVTDDRWGVFREQYEAGQGPPYYVLLAAVAAAAADASTLERLYALRVTSMLLTLATVPLTWALARAVFPRSPPVWLLAPALLVTFQGINAGGVSVTNDALVVPLGVAALLGVARALRDGPTRSSAVLAGGALGLVVLTKPTAVVVALPMALGALAAWWRHRPPARRVLAWAGGAGALAAAPVLPWLAWQRVAYDGSSAAAAFNAIIGQLVGPPRGLDRAAVAQYLADVTRGLFDYEPYRPAFAAYSMTLLGLTTAVVVAGIAVAVARRRAGAALRVAWLAAALPLGFATMLVLVQVALDGVGTIVGRYLHVALPALAVAVAAAAVVACGRRGGALVVALVAASGLTLEVGVDDLYVESVYLRGLPEPGTAPAIVQDRADALVPVTDVAVVPPCPATAIGLAFRGETPPGLTLRAGGTEQPAVRFAAEVLHGADVMGWYALPDLTGPFVVALPAGAGPIGVAADDRDPALSLPGAPGDPVARVTCPAADPRAVRFAQTHAPQHPDLPYALVRAWPRVWAVLGWAAVAVAAVNALAGAVRGAGPRTRRGTGSPGPEGSPAPPPGSRPTGTTQHPPPPPRSTAGPGSGRW